MIDPLESFQMNFGRYLRDPNNISCPKGIPLYRAEIYQELFINNISGFLDNCFPVCKRLIGNNQWRKIIYHFFREWRCQSPFFSDIPEEFLSFLQGSDILATLPEWFLELAHYEWIELLIDTFDESTKNNEPTEKTNKIWATSAMKNLIYQWPVHRISHDFLPQTPARSCIVVYRRKNHAVDFMEISPATSLLIDIVVKSPISRKDITLQIAHEMGWNDIDAMKPHIDNTIDNLIRKEIFFEHTELL